MAVVLGCYKLGSEEVGAVEGEDAPAARQRVEQIGEVGFDGGAFVQEGEGQTPGRKVVGQALGVLGRLRLDAGEGGSFGLRFDGADGFAVDVEEVVDLAKVRGDVIFEGRARDLIERAATPESHSH